MKKSRLNYWYHQQLTRDIANKIPQYLPSDLEKTPVIVINISSSRAVFDKRRLIPIVLLLEIITGQTGLLTQARCSLSTWRLKKGMEIGVKITLNNHKMWNFLDQLIHIILPHLIYFNKFNKISYDQSGNLAFGLRDFDIYPEIEWLREFSHILTRLGFITGADIVFIWKTNKNLPKNWKSLFESKSWKSSQTSNFQLFI